LGGTAEKLVVLDRDGVINFESVDFIRTPEQWIAIPGSLDAIARLTRAGFTAVVATNQSGIARGLITPAALEAIHAKMQREVVAAGGRLAGVFVCPHGPDMHCDCRKPLPGLLRQIETAFGCSLAGQPDVGDSARDLAAARAVGARPILVLTGNGRKTAQSEGQAGNLEIFDDLKAAAEALIAGSTSA
jgi:D-glycero-D-manno-heptose 1,7-bisphosphate phosphatase